MDLNVDRDFIRCVSIVCGSLLFCVYAVTKSDGLLTGAAGILIGVGIDVLRNREES